MINDINLSLFNLINANLITSFTTVKVAIFLAKRIIYIFPLIIIFFWFYGSAKNLFFQRIFVCKTTIALIISLFISGIISAFFPQERPFMLDGGVGQYFLSHPPTASFPSNHATIAFTSTFSFLFWLRTWIVLLLFIADFTISWARIFLGVHWPLDIAGAFLVSIIACGVSEVIWKIVGHKLFIYIIKAYQVLFFPLIKRGWIKD
ncbi:MAG: phosphatase PAP2 family protein [Arsenophonus sp.]